MSPFSWMPRPIRTVGKLLWHFFALLGMLVSGVVVFALATLDQRVFDPVAQALNCGEPCIVNDNPGGNVYLFQLAADQVLAGARERVVIDGLCASACAYFADKARDRVCITPRAIMGFHKGKVADDDRVRITLHHSPDIEQWVMRRGGYPSVGYLEMKFADAKKFWPVCPRS